MSKNIKIKLDIAIYFNYIMPLIVILSYLYKPLTGRDMMFCKRRLSVAFCVLLLLFSFSILSFADNAGKVNINTASVEELATLNKVGEKYAQRIVEYRETNGLFEKAEDIVNVKGIGPKIWEANKDRIVLE